MSPQAHDAQTGDDAAGTAAAQRAWPRPRAGVAACLESGGRWLAILLAGLALAALLLLALQAQQLQSLRDARLSIALHDIEERLEADLALGFELHDSARAQALLEDALAHDRSLLAAEVFDAKGLSLFNTDRGSIGEKVPQA
ncbi:MAG TPA: hypothetical protein VLJ58_10855, partial [Ramlibacter sp.]|nr:hypothetical protein [Ramlibacter sp.]